MNNTRAIRDALVKNISGTEKTLKSTGTIVVQIVDCGQMFLDSLDTLNSCDKSS